MSTLTKLALGGHPGQRTSLADLFGQVRRAWTENAGRRRVGRPLQDIDGWSDQAEVAFYEDSHLARCG